MRGYSFRASKAPPTIFCGPKSPPMASRAIFIEPQFCGGRNPKAKRKWEGPLCPDYSLRQDRGAKAPATLRADAQHLAAFIIAAGSTSGMRLNRAPALRALVQQRGGPAMRRLAGAQAHLRSFAFRDSHKGKQESRNLSKNKSRRGFSVQGSGFRRKSWSA